MDKKKAYKIAIKAMQSELKKVSFDANLYRMNMAKTPQAEKSAQKYVDLCQAIQFLETDLKEKTFLNNLPSRCENGNL